MRQVISLIIIACLCTAPQAARCQTDDGASELLKAFGKVFQRFAIFPFEPLVNKPPLESSTFSSPSPISEPPTLQSGVDEKLIHILHSGGFASSNGFLYFHNGSKIEYKGYVIQANEITINKAAQLFIGTGNAHLDGSGAKVVAQKIIVDYKNRTYQAFQQAADLNPSLVGGILISDIYISGLSSTGNERESFVNNAKVTTCPYPDPHYYLKCQYIDVRYGIRAVLRNADLYVLDRKILHIPFISIPLDDRNYRNLPYVGQDPVEGYFIKSHYGIPLKGNNSLFTELDYMTKLGLGIGATYSYLHQNKLGGYNGSLGIYSVTGSKSFDLSQSQVSKMKWGTFSLQNSIQNHDYLVDPDGVIIQNQASLLFPAKSGSFGLNYSRNETSSNGFDSTNQSLGLKSLISWNSHIKSVLQATYNEQASQYTVNNSPTSTNTQTININFNAQDDLKQANAALDYQRTIPIGTIQNFYSGVEETPNLTLSTDSTKLLGPIKGNDFPFQTSASIGQFGDPNSGGMVTRDFFKLGSNKTFQNSDGRSLLTLNALFTQGLYSDDTAQYSLSFGSNYHYRFGKDTAFDFNYNYLRPEGYSPLGIDAVGKLNVMTSDITVRPLRTLKVGVQSGYDALQISNGFTPWQPFGVLAEYSPRPFLLARANATYDPYIKSWSNIRFDSTYRPGATLVQLGLRYDATRHTFGQINGLIQALKWGKTKIDLLATYNGYAKQFSNQQLSLTYNLHDSELIFQVINNQFGFHNGVQFALYFRLNAIPFTTGFGSGTRGQPIGIGTGVGY